MHRNCPPPPPAGSTRLGATRGTEVAGRTWLDRFSKFFHDLGNYPYMTQKNFGRVARQSGAIHAHAGSGGK